MLRRGAAFAFAACIMVWPVGAGSDTDTFWNTPSAAVLGSVTAPAFAPAQQPVAAVAANVLAENSGGKDQAPPQDTLRTEAAAQATAPDRSETIILRSHPSAPALAPALASTSQQVAAAEPADKSDGRDQAQSENNTRADGSTRMAALDPAQPESPLSPSPPQMSEPFDLAVTPVAFGPVLAKWQGVESRIRAESEIFADCASSTDRCPQAARNFLAIVAQGRALSGLARIGVINRAVNMAIEPMSDMAQWGEIDRWSPPLETFATGRGDCEDYAIAKYVALTAAGMPAQDVKLVIVRNIAANEDHAIVAVRNGDDWIMLDNRWLTMVKDVEMPRIAPLFVLDDAGVREFVSPAIAVAQRMPAPASLLR